MKTYTKFYATTLLIASLFVAQPALTAPPDEVITRITELNALVQSQSERISKLEALLQNQGLLGMLNQLDALKVDVAHLRGSQEEQTHRQEMADKRARDLYADLDERIKEIASRPVAASYDAIRLQPTKTLLAPSVLPDSNAPANTIDPESEARAYEVALGLIKAGKYADAIVTFQAFLTQYPSGKLAANALYWIGISHVTGHADYKSAADIYRRLLKEYPTSPKAADAMLSLARAQIQLEDKTAARETLNQLLEKFSSSKAAESGKKLLQTLD